MTTHDLHWGIAREMTAVYALGLDIGEDAHHERRREYMVRRAAAADRLSDSDGGDPIAAAETIHDAVHYARALLAHDRLDDTGRGPLPAHDPRWLDDPRGYARQEHRAWILDREV
ncbi:hypothetical protein [Streptomyces sp. DSM 40750]|uniref:hypothetical protein n=1 Tax=Streptomyces sp. DSM 40750 TaxID=2801030 RepID=UPI00214B0F1B|nr:hypothetical protein [Streptomyces sp. DSM 40750]UUU21695.1 hypothetical protein JIX55_15935 [Streptomyces sp. DSM 40750]